MNIDWKSLGLDARLKFGHWHGIFSTPELVTLNIEKEPRSNVFKCFIKVTGFGERIEVAPDWKPWEIIYLTCRFIILQQALERGEDISVNDSGNNLSRKDLTEFDKNFRTPLNPGQHKLDTLLGRNN